MQLVAHDPRSYLGGDDVIDLDGPGVRALAGSLSAAHADRVAFARAAFEHVRDHIRHSFDVGDPRVPVSASETLGAGVGLCYAKAHLLTALLRCGGVPTGLCYQRLTDDGEYFMLHGLVAVHLDGRWHRQDPRGNKPGVDAQFSTTAERLAWSVRADRGEHDHPEVHVHPSRVVVAALRATTDALTLRVGGLPDRP